MYRALSTNSQNRQISELTMPKMLKIAKEEDLKNKMKQQYLEKQLKKDDSDWFRSICYLI